MTDKQMLNEYIIEIVRNFGVIPDCADDPTPMKIAKLDDAWRKALKG